MLIGIDASRANRDHKSGTEWYSFYIIRWLAKLDKDNQYILYSDEPLKSGLLDLSIGNYPDKESAGLLEYDKKGYQIIKSPHNNFRAKILKWPFKYFWTQGRLSLEMIFSRPNVLFIPAHALPFIHPKKSVITVHDIGYERTIKTYETDQIGPKSDRQKSIINLLVRLASFGRYRATPVDYLKWSTRFGLKHAQKIIAISKYTKKDIIEYYQADEKKISIIYNGYNRTLFTKINNQEKIDKVLYKYGIARPYLFYIGRIERKKNIPALIEAFAIMREKNKEINHKLVLVGDASYGYDEVKYMTREFDLVNEVIMTGWMQEIDIPYIYNGADGFVFPSHYEGFGIPLLQAMACEVPIAASRTTSIPEVTEGAARLFDPNYALSIADAMVDIVTDQELRQDLIAKGKKRVRNFNWKKTAVQTLEVITYK